MLGALLYLRLTSLKNLLLSRLRRLRQPKYLLGAAVGAAYFYFIFSRPFGGAGRPSTSSGSAAAASFTLSPVELVPLLSVFGAFALVLIALFTWLVPSEKPGLTFSEAEVAFLFPAPISRRRLIHFRLLGAQLHILLSAIFFTLLSRGWSFLGGHVLTHIVGWWLVLTVVNLHFTGAALTLNRIFDAGISVWRRRLVILGGLTVLVVAAAIPIWQNAPAFPTGNFGPGAFFSAIARTIDTGLLHWLLFPGKLLLAPFLAADLRTFFFALGPAALLLGAHYFWVSRLEVSFEEASVAHAEKRAARVERFQAGDYRLGSAPAKARREPFPLRVPGRPELAFLWKNLLGTRAVFHWRVWAGCAVAIMIGVPWIIRAGGTAPFAAIIAVVAAVFAIYTLLLGPQLARQDLRSDLPNSDILKTYPLTGWQILLGELLTPIAILTGLLWLSLLAVMLALAPRAETVSWLTPGFRLTAGLCAAAVIPALCTLQLLIPNAAALLFPAWFQSTRTRGGGIELMGQRLIFVMGQLFVILISLLPVVVGCVLVIFASQWLIGPTAAVVLATLLALAILAAEIAGGLWWLGERFEKLDLATELRP